MRNFVLTITITICICIGIKKLYNLTFEPSTPQQYTLIEREPWQRQAIATKNNNWDFMPTTSVSKHTTSYPKVNYRFVTPSVKSATVKYNFTQPLKTKSFGRSYFGSSAPRDVTSSYSPKAAPANSGTISIGGRFGGFGDLSLRQRSKEKENEETDNGLLALSTPFGPMLAPPTVGGDYDGETPDIGVEDAVDDEGLDIESAPIGNATYMLPFILLYSLFLKRKTLKHIII